MQLLHVSKPRLWAALIAAAIAAGCGSSQKAGPAHPSAAKTGVVTSPALAYLPAGTPAAVWAKSPRALAAAIGWNALVKKHAPLAKVAAQARASVGIDLFDPDAWANAGVDPARPFGFALLTLHPRSFAVFFSVASAAKFKTFFADVSKKMHGHPASSKQGEAEILSDGSDGGRIVLRGDQIILIIGRNSAAQAKMIAMTMPTNSLAGSAAYKAAMKRLDMGAHIAGYADLRSLLENLPLGAGEEALLGMNQLTFGVNLDPHAIRVELAAQRPSSAGAHLFRPAKTTPAILRATKQTPMALMSFSVDPAALLQRVEKRIGSGKIARLKMLAKGFLHIDIDKDVIPLLTGEVGLAWTTSTLDLGKDSVPRAFGFNVTIGVTDGARARALLDRLLGNPMLGGSIHKDRDGWYEVPLHNFFHTVYLGVAGNEIVASTDRSIGQRLSAGTSAGSFTARLPASARRLLASPHPTGVVAMHTGTIVAMGMAKAIGEDLPASKDPKASAAERRIQTLRHSQHLLHKQFMNLARRTGTTVLVTRISDDAIVAKGGQFFAAGSHLAGLIDEALDLAMRIHGNSQALERAFAKRAMLRAKRRAEKDQAAHPPAQRAGGSHAPGKKGQE